MSKTPNVIVFFTDQQRWDTSGLHGCPLDITPNFDRMAQAGTHIDSSITCQPVCGPARSCLQTGLYATQTGSWRNGIPLDPNLKTIAQHFKEGGYETSYIGKWHLGTTDGAVPKHERGGYDRWLAANLLEFVSDSYDCVLFDEDDQRVKLPGYRVDAMTDAAIRYIDDANKREQPFFLFLSYLEPHHQNHLDDYPPPVGYRDKYTGRWTPPDLQALGGSSGQHLGGYYGMVKRCDEALGRIQDALRSLDMSDDTIIMYTSDHGCHFKTRNAEYKRSCHEASVRVPTAFAGPGFQGGGRRSEVMSLVDLVPTLVDAAGLGVPKEMSGRSLMPILRGESKDWANEALIQISESQVGRALRTRRWKYGIVDEQGDGQTQSSSDAYDEAFLYDLESDPYELQNLIDCESHDEVAGILRVKLLAAMERAGEKRPEVRLATRDRKTQRKVSAAEVV
ncbi:sulfatase-like hydrolase/transferase [Pelagicoccus sp. NFK12]|uniref:Sulfatase-like hydrolase/transferase n=1 Tax=Pelagicoccus enzymogenes TaxID=2773457 RepID=A0A927FA53_9BACT|nr:sulfatase-like hydrolase/transferase [Pelagicoccus enzymogenes]MBD5780655.1 sulfatase-like hydrolase/transferase [Pelagicoccus enzymogenes]